jgi:glycosyltransferase involved in cell wall biosynthesis
MMMSSPKVSPKVSIVINCFNQGHYLERCVDSVLAQTFTDFECLIVDDGSTDQTGLIAQELTKRDPRLRYLRKENGGLPAARNYGVANTTGEWVQCLDADDWIHPEKTQRQLEQAQASNLKNVILYCDYERVYFDADDRVVQQEVNTIGPKTTAEILTRLVVPDWLVGDAHPALQQCFLMHRDIFQQHSFPEEFLALGDRYFAVDVLMNGVEFVYTPFVGTYYTKHTTNRTNRWDYMRGFYLRFYERVFKAFPTLQADCTPGIAFLINEAVRDRRSDVFTRLLPLHKHKIQLDFWFGSIVIGQWWLLQILYQLRLVIPNFLLYKKYQGPRFERVMEYFQGQKVDLNLKLNEPESSLSTTELEPVGDRV